MNFDVVATVNLRDVVATVNLRAKIVIFFQVQRFRIGIFGSQVSLTQCLG